MIESVISRMHEIDLSIPPERTGWVYVLLDGGEATYIGQTTNIGQRIGMHQQGTERAAAKKFDRAFRIEVPLADMDALEGALIRRFNPRDCGTAPKDRNRDAEMLSRFGIDPDASAHEAFRARQAERWRGMASERRVRNWSQRSTWGRHSRLSRALWRAALRLIKKAHRVSNSTVSVSDSEVTDSPHTDWNRTETQRNHEGLS